MSRISDEKLAASLAVPHTLSGPEVKSILLELQHYRSLSADPRVVEIRERHEIWNDRPNADWTPDLFIQDGSRCHADRALLLSLFPETKETA